MTLEEAKAIFEENGTLSFEGRKLELQYAEPFKLGDPKVPCYLGSKAGIIVPSENEEELLQALREFKPEDFVPMEGPALVLMDKIDEAVTWLLTGNTPA